MNKLPRTFLLGVTQPNREQLRQYLIHTDQLDFLESYDAAIASGTPDFMCLISAYAKMCYKSLVLGKNANVSRVRDIEYNIQGVVKSKHGSVLEHVTFNFVTTDCSRILTHELVRHRAGTAFSQTSGRYVALDEIDTVMPDEMRGESMEFPWLYENGEVYNKTIDEVVQSHVSHTKTVLKWLRDCLIRPDMPFDMKKKLTSAIRRLAPNGQTNEIGWSANLRALRHMLEMRTSRHAEWEIRLVFHEVGRIIEEKYPLALCGGQRVEVDGFDEWTGLRV
jgi:thymidylate synthase (FAD)